tara:strand:- start:495 stop:1529 length:1035 start_codon:yes stop_codon:yes gene_type:complete
MKEAKIKNKSSIIKKIFIKLCRSLGYEIIDQNNFTLPTSNQSAENSLSVQGKISLTLPMGVTKIKRPIKALDIILRTCASVNMLTQTKKRLFENEKKEYSIRTLNSIVKSLNFSKDKLSNIKINITIIDHNSERNVLDTFKSILSNQFFQSKIINLDFDKYKPKINKINEEKNPVTYNQMSNMSNIHQSLEQAKNCEDLIYFVEDDYIHTKNSILEMILAYEKFSTILNNELFLCPADYPYLYNNLNETNVILGDKSHWRKIDQTLCTFLTSNKMITKYFEDLKNMCKYEHYPFEKPLHKIYAKEYCFSPIPSLAMHCTNINSIYGLPPNFDIKKIWEENAYND